jgi:hypothetical protein
VIEDIEGATSEPTRRRHVAALSGAMAAVSLALFLALIVPPSREAERPSPEPSPTASVTLTITSNPIRNVRLDLTLDSVCPDGTRLIPPYDLVFGEPSGQVFAVRYVVGRVAHSVPVTVVADKRTPYLTVACGIADLSPWTDR